MGGASQQSFSKPAPWVVEQRIRRRTLGPREFQVKRMILTELAAMRPFPSLKRISDECEIDGTGNVCRIVRNLMERGEIPMRQPLRNSGSQAFSMVISSRKAAA